MVRQTYRQTAGQPKNIIPAVSDIADISHDIVDYETNGF